MEVEQMAIKEENISIISKLPEHAQKQVHEYLTQNYCNPFRPKSTEEIYAELAESRDCYARGEYRKVSAALDEMKKKYGF
jgi:hypothetical protein